MPTEPPTAFLPELGELTWLGGCPQVIGRMRLKRGVFLRITALAWPAFAATVAVQRAMGIDPDGEAGWATSAWVTTALSVGVITALIGAPLLLALLHRARAGYSL